MATCMNVRKAYFDHQVSDRSPGPATYSLRPAHGQQVDSNKPTQPETKFGTSTRPPLLETGNDTPGAKYHTQGTFGVQVSSTKRSNVPIQFGTSTRAPLLDAGLESPGAIYESTAAHGKQVRDIRTQHQCLG